MERTITIQTSEGEVTYELASFGQRLAARILDSLIIVIPNSLIPLVPSWLYWSLMQSSKYQSTLGQRTLNIKVVSLDGAEVSFGQATGRFFANFLSVMILFLGYIMFFFTENRQCLHDYLSGCVVVKDVALSRSDDVSAYFVD